MDCTVNFFCLLDNSAFLYKHQPSSTLGQAREVKKKAKDH